MRRDETGGVDVGALMEFASMRRHFEPWLPQDLHNTEQVLLSYLKSFCSFLWEALPICHSLLTPKNHSK